MAGTSDKQIVLDVGAAGLTATFNVKVHRLLDLASTYAAGEGVSIQLCASHPNTFSLLVFLNGVDDSSEDSQGWIDIYIKSDCTDENTVTCDAYVEVLSPGWQSLPGYRCRKQLLRSRQEEHAWFTFLSRVEDLSRNGFIEDGHLYLRICLTLNSHSFKQEPVDNSHVAHAKELAKDVGSLLDSHIKSDVTLIAGGEEFPSHWNVLTCRSSVFMRMLESGMSESELKKVEVPDVDAPTMRYFLHYLYTGSTTDFEAFTKIKSPLGWWHYGVKSVYEIRETDGRLMLFERPMPERTLVQGQLQQRSASSWGASLSNGGHIELSLMDNMMISEYKEEGELLSVQEAHNPEEEIVIAERWAALLQIADKYDIVQLVTHCEEVMTSMLNTYNAAALLHIANRIGRQGLKVAVLGFITMSEKQLRSVQNTQAFDLLSQEVLAEVLSAFLDPAKQRKRHRATSESLEFPDGSNWARLSGAQLRTACAERGLPTSGTPEHLVGLLEAREA